MAKQDPKEINELKLIWIHVKKKSPDCRCCFPNPRKLHKSRKKQLRVCYNTRIRFWTQKTKMDAYKQQIEDLEDEIRTLEDADPFENIDPIYNEGYD